ncbi:hypothetical protein CARUB_v10025995mg [Capsella rubella]|uniref:Glucose/Sorbosone dehydrogenase domain-containing protein n=2 Tax=Capsella rubella TaxID=81985 RepID=R0G7L1_9BRAS|nr:HIPL2 protein [Capsella rubella]EOA12479.1 hypothetical protein CARUB_v10025995mg [Capsella rubella]
MAKTNQAITICSSLLLLLLSATTSHPLCSDSKTPVNNNETLQFCDSYTGRSCCTSKDDLQLQNRFNSMNISDSNCSSLLKSILCAKCDQSSGQLFNGDDTSQIPILCNSTSQDLCSKLWDSCQNISIVSSPFSPTLLGGATSPSPSSNSSTLTDLWKSQTEFCTAFGGPSQTNNNITKCFNGKPVNKGTGGGDEDDVKKPPKGICLEKIGTGSYLNMVAHPDGSNRAFFSNQPGKIWLGTIPDQDSGKPMEIDESTPFVDITDQVSFDTQFGMMGMAFHPKFADNGRFFASFNCDKVKSPGCSGRCACNSDVNCDPSKLPKDDGAQPCRFQTVVAEYTANGTSSSPSTAKIGKASEVRRIFTMGLPYSSSHGGQILFGPDGYLYLMTGDGGGVSDTHNFAQNKKSLLGKILRLDIDVMPSVSDITKLGLWGNYSIPKNNPFQGNENEQPEIWALGLRNPWRCSFDSERPDYFLCADVGKDTYEEVDIITMGGNYGWRTYEGPYVFSPLSPFGENVSTDSNLTFPILGYNHSEVNKHEGSASIIGGYFYRSNTDPCSYGTYLYADLYANAMWAAIESPQDSGNFTDSLIPFSCSKDSPMKCTAAPGGASSGPALGYIYSFGQDNNKDIHLLTSSGVYRMVRPSRCNLACSKENTTASAGKQSPDAASPPQSLPSSARKLCFSVFLLLSLLLMFLTV